MKRIYMVLLILAISCCQGCMQVNLNGNIERQGEFHYKGDTIPVTFARKGDSTVPSLELLEAFKVLMTKISLKRHEWFSSIVIKTDKKITINTFIKAKIIKTEKKGVLDYLTETPSPTTSEGRVFEMDKKDGIWILSGEGSWIS